MTTERKKLYRKFLIGYVGCFSLPLFALIFGLAQGASWRPVIVGVPVYLTFLAGITYQFAKEFSALRRKERGESDLPITNSFPGASNSVNKLLDNPSFSNSIQKGLTKHLGAK